MVVRGRGCECSVQCGASWCTLGNDETQNAGFYIYVLQHKCEILGFPQLELSFGIVGCIFECCIVGSMPRAARKRNANILHVELVIRAPGCFARARGRCPPRACSSRPAALSSPRL
jgi:hypothetical protein